jgi:hypothetical protein
VRFTPPKPVETFIVLAIILSFWIGVICESMYATRGLVPCLTDYECETGERQVLPEDGCPYAPPHTEDLGSPEIPRLVPAPREAVLEA